MIEITTKEIELILRQKKIRPSYLRIKVLEYFFKHHNHPSVNMIYEELQGTIPTLSKTSVYNTLNLFDQNKIIESLGATENEQRYDLYRSKPHAHFYCEVCGDIYDVNLDIDAQLGNAFSDFEIKSHSLQFKGICPKCKK
ncbi:transcriptional repressor [Erysipelotrichaceae bacterium]|nr:transcriptional repressor [Erysipelotrichaceae bacterium]